MGDCDHVVLRLVPDRSAILNSRERAPFLLFVETMALPDATADDGWPHAAPGSPPVSDGGSPVAQLAAKLHLSDSASSPSAAAATIPAAVASTSAALFAALEADRAPATSVPVATTDMVSTCGAPVSDSDDERGAGLLGEDRATPRDEPEHTATAPPETAVHAAETAMRSDTDAAPDASERAGSEAAEAPAAAVDQSLPPPASGPSPAVSQEHSFAEHDAGSALPAAGSLTAAELAEHNAALSETPGRSGVQHGRVPSEEALQQMVSSMHATKLAEPRGRGVHIAVHDTSHAEFASRGSSAAPRPPPDDAQPAPPPVDIMANAAEARPAEPEASTSSPADSTGSWVNVESGSNGSRRHEHSSDGAAGAADAQTALPPRPSTAGILGDPAKGKQRWPRTVGQLSAEQVQEMSVQDYCAHVHGASLADVAANIRSTSPYGG